MKCVYHSKDLDGKGSGAIVKLAHPEAELIGFDYGETFPWERVAPGETVFMVDVSLPVADMKRLYEITEGNFVWIDHHFTAIEDVRAAGIEPLGLRQIDKSAIELTWAYFHPKEVVPEIVSHLGRYDRWDLSDPATLPVQYGMRIRDHDPENSRFWQTAVDNFGGIVMHLADDGTKIWQYVKGEFAAYAKKSAFVTELPGGVRALACNRGLADAQLLEPHFDPDRHDCIVLFYWEANQWRFSLYVPRRKRNPPNVGMIAKRFGGGGTASAAGFTADKIPFKLPGR